MCIITYRVGAMISNSKNDIKLLKMDGRTKSQFFQIFFFHQVSKRRYFSDSLVFVKITKYGGLKNFHEFLL